MLHSKGGVSRAEGVDDLRIMGATGDPNQVSFKQSEDPPGQCLGFSVLPLAILWTGARVGRGYSVMNPWMITSRVLRGSEGELVSGTHIL